MRSFLSEGKPSLFNIILIGIGFLLVILQAFLLAILPTYISIAIFVGLVAIASIFISPYWGLVFIIILEAFFMQDKELTGGGLLSGAKVVGLVTVISYFTHTLLGRDKPTIKRTLLDIPILAYLSLSIISLLWSEELAKSLDALFAMLAQFALFFLVVQLVDTPKKVSRLINLWIFMTIVLLIFVLWQEEGGLSLPDPFTYNYRFGRSFGSPNVMAQWLLLILGPTLNRFISASRSRSAPLYLFLSITIVYFIIITGSRGAWLGVLAVVIFLLTGFTRRVGNADTALRTNSNVVRRTMIILSILILTVASWLFITTRFDFSGARSQDVSQRRDDVAMSWMIFTRNPILGSGMGDYIIQRGELLELTSEFGSAPKSPHSLYLGILAQLGLLGFICLIWILINIFRMVKKSQIPSQGTLFHADYWGIASSLIGYAIYSFFHFSLYYNLLWVAIGLIAAVYTFPKSTVDTPS